MKHLLILNSSALALSISLLFTINTAKAEPTTQAPVKKVTQTPPTGKEDGWVQLTGKDFQNVNCKEDTWRWEGGHAF